MSLLALLHVACLVLLAALLLAAGAQDLRSMHIANGFSIAIVGLFAVSTGIDFAVGAGSPANVGFSIACAAVVFCVGAAAFAVGALGGGDVKFLAAVSLFAGPAQIVNFLAITSIAGGVLGIAILAGAPIGRPAAATAGPSLRARLKRDLPYGPAIAAGGLWVAASLALT